MQSIFSRLKIAQDNSLLKIGFRTHSEIKLEQDGEVFAIRFICYTDPHNLNLGQVSKIYPDGRAKTFYFDTALQQIISTKIFDPFADGEIEQVTYNSATDVGDVQAAHEFAHSIVDGLLDPANKRLFLNVMACSKKDKMNSVYPYITGRNEEENAVLKRENFIYSRGRYPVKATEPGNLSR